MSTKFVTSSGSGYLPPYLRNRAAPELKKPEVLKMDDTRQFPGLKSMVAKAEEVVQQKASFWSGMVSFKDTIVNLIEEEKKTEAQRKTEREKDREKDAWARLPLKFNKERLIQFNEKMLAANQRTVIINNLIYQGYSVEANLNSDIVYNDSDVDCFSVSTDSYDENQINADEDDVEEEHEEHAN
jgi:hypothetical protein